VSGATDEARQQLSEAQFRWASNEDAMAAEKPAEGIRQFARSQEKLEAVLASYEPRSGNDGGWFLNRLLCFICPTLYPVQPIARLNILAALQKRVIADFMLTHIALRQVY